MWDPAESEAINCVEQVRLPWHLPTLCRSRQRQRCNSTLVLHSRSLDLSYWQHRRSRLSFQRASRSTVRSPSSNRLAWHSTWVEKLHSTIRLWSHYHQHVRHSMACEPCSSTHSWHNKSAQPRRRHQHCQRGLTKRQTKQRGIQSLTFQKLLD